MVIAITYVIPDYFSTNCYADFVTQVIGYDKILSKELLLILNNHLPCLHFKQVHDEHPYSVRVSLSYRALDVIENETIVWFWIGSHQDYNNLVSQL